MESKGTYFDLLPSELITIISLFLNVNDIIQLGDVINVIYEELYRITFRRNYEIIKHLCNLMQREIDWKENYIKELEFFLLHYNPKTETTIFK